jgi:hypothetical protein
MEVLIVKITLTSTTKLVTLQIGEADVPARIWEGHTESGIPIHAYVTRIAVAEGLDTAQFERELRSCEKPTAAVEAIPLRLIL